MTRLSGKYGPVSARKPFGVRWIKKVDRRESEESSQDVWAQVRCKNEEERGAGRGCLETSDVSKYANAKTGLPSNREDPEYAYYHCQVQL